MAKAKARRNEKAGIMPKEWLYYVLVELSALVYVLPLVSSNNEEAVLDEMYLLDPSRSNQDVKGVSSLSQVFSSDYWGRSIHTDSSHKSWRPFSVLLLRYLNNDGEAGLLFGLPIKPILLQRLLNVALHVVTASLVGKLAVTFFAPAGDQKLQKATQYLAFMLFALHPAHVEVVANVANRPHLTALFCALMTIDTKKIEFVILFWAIGLLSCETMVFQLPAVLMTATIVRLRTRGAESLSSLRMIVSEMLPRYLVWIGLTVLYLVGRFAWGTLSIPEGLLERAESPFAHLEGFVRLLSFAYIVAVHVGKSFGIDWIGFAHEYSHVCIDPVKSLSDFRLMAPLLIGAVIVSISLALAQRPRLMPVLSWITALAWMATLFPISGLLNVGTFIADRMCMASSVVMAMYGGFFTANKVLQSRPWLALIVLFLLGFWTPRVWMRTNEWTEHKLLFDRTLQTCPKSAKNLLQLSKVYSGSSGSKIIDMEKSLAYVQEANDADPEFCRVHLQFAHIHLRQEEFRKAEFHLVRALDCPTTASQAMGLWKQYWAAHPDQDAATKQREKVMKQYEVDKKQAEMDRRMEQLFSKGMFRAPRNQEEL
jgi:hypothetical protein